MYVRDRYSGRVVWWETPVHTRSHIKIDLCEFETQYLNRDEETILRVYVEGRRHDYWVYFRCDDPSELLKSMTIAPVMYK